MNKEKANRECRLQIRLSEKEKETLIENAKNCGLSQSEYFRRNALGENIYVLGSKEEMKEILKEIHKTGVNINQIAHNLNSNIYVGVKEDLKEVINQQAEILNKFMKIYNRINKKIEREEKKKKEECINEESKNTNLNLDKFFLI